MSLLLGDCLVVMATLAADSVDAIVTDPPYALTANKKGGPGEASVSLETPYGRARIGTGNGGGGFMGKAWDSALPPVEVWAEALRVAKPGAHLLAFGGTRTFHRLTCAIEDAGWEIRDCLSWLYGSGFPKSLDVSKAMDKAAAVEREVIGRSLRHGGGTNHVYGEGMGDGVVPMLTAPATDLAKQWDGWGTALKPAWEPIILARKPLTGTVAANVAAHGTGALNVDGCRIATDDKLGGGAETVTRSDQKGNDGWTRPWMEDPAAQEGHAARVRANVEKAEALGRWPANVVLDEAAAALLDEQSGERPSGGGIKAPPGKTNGFAGERTSLRHDTSTDYEASIGGASRFFFCAKSSRSEREAGLEDFEPVRRTDGRETDVENPRLRTGARTNHHPTVKPLDLMRWLCRMVTPPGGLVLDPFTGSGTTGCAAILEGFRFLGIEREAEYVAIAKRRLARARLTYQPNLFALAGE